jgi:hypothetical protein
MVILLSLLHLFSSIGTTISQLVHKKRKKENIQSNKLDPYTKPMTMHKCFKVICAQKNKIR